MIVLNVDMKAVAGHILALQKMHRKYMPMAVRDTLNKSALDMKQTEIEVTANKVFTRRQKNFLKANSKVEFAKGFDIAQMQSMMGLKSLKPKVVHDYAIEDLPYQEVGGNIPNKSFNPTEQARQGQNKSKMVAAANRLTKIGDGMFDSGNTNLHGVKNNKEAFVLTAIYAKKGGVVIGNEKNKDGSKGVFLIQSVTRIKKPVTTKSGKVYKRGNTLVKSKEIYTLKKGRKARVKATHFIKNAGQLAQKKMTQFFIEAANKYIK